MRYAIETDELSKIFGPVRAVDGVSLRVAPGEMYGFIGLNGAGKTTTVRVLLGMIHPTAGSVAVLGEAVGPHGRGPWRRVGHLVERPAAYPELTVRENLDVARRLYGVRDGTTVDRGHRRAWVWRRTPGGGPASCPRATCSGWGWPARCSTSRSC